MYPNYLCCTMMSVRHSVIRWPRPLALPKLCSIVVVRGSSRCNSRNGTCTGRQLDTARVGLINGFIADSNNSDGGGGSSCHLCKIGQSYDDTTYLMAFVCVYGIHEGRNRSTTCKVDCSRRGRRLRNAEYSCKWFRFRHVIRMGTIGVNDESRRIFRPILMILCVRYSKY